MNYILLAISMSVALLSGIGSKYYISTYNKGEHTNHIFNSIVSFFCIVTLLLWNDGFKISWFTLLLSLGYGTITAVQKIFSLKAMKIGPWSYTSVIASLSTIIPTLSGAVIWKEQISIIQIVGILLMLTCMCLAVDVKKDSNNVSSSKNGRWMFYCIILFIATGMIGVMQKWHQSTGYKNELSEFLIVSFIFSCIFTTICAFKTRKEANAKENRKKVFSVIPLVIMVYVGVMSAVNNRLNLFLSGELDSSIMFPLVNGGGLMLTTIAATLIFKERLSKNQWIGLLLGVVAVILICNPFKL